MGICIKDSCREVAETVLRGELPTVCSNEPTLCSLHSYIIPGSSMFFMWQHTAGGIPLVLFSNFGSGEQIGYECSAQTFVLTFRF